jgi:hypothetical protein
MGRKAGEIPEMETAIDWAEIEKDVDAQLARARVADRSDLALDRAQIEAHARDIAAGRMSKATNAVPGELEPAGPATSRASRTCPPQRAGSSGSARPRSRRAASPWQC